MLWRKGITNIEHINRYKEVANVFIKHGFGFVFDRLSLQRVFGLFKKQRRFEKNDIFTRPQRLRMALEELGPTYIKMGQLLSIRPDLLSGDYIKELEKLQDNVPPVAAETAIYELKRQGLDPEKAFQFFDPVPIAAASMAQVHSACLFNGDKVVVKIQRPGIRKIINADLEILADVSRMLEKRADWARLYHISDIIEELSTAIRSELDFLNEGRNADFFRSNFSRESNVIIPKIYWDYCTENVLVMEYVSGIKMQDVLRSGKFAINKKVVAERLLQSLFMQIFVHGFFHADPHPGNIAISADEKIIFYDFGQIGTIDRLLKDKCVDLVISMMHYDVRGVTDALLSIAIGSQTVKREDLIRDVAKLEQKYYGLPMSQIKLGESLGELLELTSRYQVRIPSELSLMAKMLMTVESVIIQLDPQISIVDIAEPYGRKLVMQRYSPRRIYRQTAVIASDYAMLMQNLPLQANNLLRLLNDGEFSLKMEHSNLKQVTSMMDLVSNRLSAAIILAAIISGSAMIIDRTGSGFVTRLPLADIGFILAVVLGFVLIYSIFKNGRQ